METEKTIPILPCISINDTLDFYVMLGFEIIYQQERPNTYACVKRGGIELHFFSMKGYDDPATSYSTCSVITADVDTLYQDFVARMRQRHHKVLVVGIPRMTPLRDKAGHTRGFNVIDPGGNWIRIAQYRGVPDGEDETERKKDKISKLEKAWRMAEILADKGDPEIAARTLDTALARHEDATLVQRVQALVVRATLALTMEDSALARRLLEEVRHLPLMDEERGALGEELQRAADLEAMLVAS